MTFYSHCRDIYVKIIQNKAIYKIPIYTDNIDKILSSRIQDGNLIVEASLKKNWYSNIETCPSLPVKKCL